MYSAFYQFVQAKLAYGGLILALANFSPLSQLYTEVWNENSQKWLKNYYLATLI